MKKDILNRTEVIDRLKSFILKLSDKKKGFCFAVNGKWGSGKSFVLDMLEKELREYQDEKTADNKFFLVHYNCWQYDYYEEPSVAIVSAMLNSVDTEKCFIGKEADGAISAACALIKDEVKTIAGKFLENHIGVDPVSVYDKIMQRNDDTEAKKQKFDTLFSFKNTLDEVRVSLNTIAKEKTIIMVVDELDRCIPEYAIKVLERLHHLFEDIDNIVVIVAVDKTQLSHSIKTIYGEETLVDGYLKKIIDLTFELDTGQMSQGMLEKYNSFFEKFSIYSKNEEKQIEEFFTRVWGGIDIRTQEKLIERTEIIHLLLTEKQLDISLALLEILIVAIYDGTLHSIKWLSNVPMMVRKSIEELIGVDKIDYIKKIEELSRTGRERHTTTFNGIKVRHQFSDDLFGKMFYLANGVFEQTLSCYLNDQNEYQEEIEIGKEFVEMIKIIL